MGRGVVSESITVVGVQADAVVLEWKKFHTSTYARDFCTLAQSEIFIGVCAIHIVAGFGKGTDHRRKAIGEAAHNGAVAEEYRLARCSAVHEVDVPLDVAPNIEAIAQAKVADVSTRSVSH